MTNPKIIRLAAPLIARWQFCWAILVLVCFALSAQAAPSLQPLTYENVVSYFKSAGLRTTEVQKRCTIFFEGEWKNRNVYSYALIIVENSDEDIQITFYLTDAHQMNWITEFLDAPFFTQSETGRLFDLTNREQELSARKVGRFRVAFHRWRPRHADIIVFSFTRA